MQVLTYSIAEALRDDMADPVRTIVARTPEGHEVGSLLCYDNRAGHPDGVGEYGFIQVDILNVKPEARRTGLASALMRELERLNPGVMLEHGILTEEGRAWNAAYYGPPLGAELSPVRMDDPDIEFFLDYAAGIEDGVIFRGGWTRDGARIPTPFPDFRGLMEDH